MNFTCKNWFTRLLGLLFVLTSALGALRAEDAPANDGRQIVFMIGEPEYRTDETLPEYFKTELAADGYRAKFIVAARDGAEQHDFDGLEAALSEADLLVLSVRRRAPTQSQLQAVRDYLISGRPLVAIRTASHAFDTRGDSPTGHEQWLGFDEAVLGGKYSGHFGDEPIRIDVAENAKDDPLLRGVESWASSKLYQCELQSPHARLLLVGQRPNGERQPVAWTNQYGPGSARVLYTSLGIDTDFQDPAFRRFLRNAIEWALGHGETN